MIGLSCAHVKPLPQYLAWAYDGPYMANTPKDDNPREVKVYFKPSEIEEIDLFRKTWWRKKSRNELFHLAIEFYMDRMRRSKGVMLNDFPVDVAAEEHLPYLRGKPGSR